MPANEYVVGTTVRVPVTFVDESTGQKLDPGTVTAMFLRPGDRTILTAPAVRDATGEWHADQLVDKPGWWDYRFEGLNPDVAIEGGFNVKHSRFKG